MRHLRSALGALAFCCVAATAQDVLVTVDAHDNCLDTTAMTGGNASFTIPPGTYSAYLENNTMMCEPGGSKYCAINSVFFQIGDQSPKKDSAVWGMTARNGATVKVGVHSAADAGGLAFVSDSLCEDNIGQVTLHFHRLGQVRPRGYADQDPVK